MRRTHLLRRPLNVALQWHRPYRPYLSLAQSSPQRFDSSRHTMSTTTTSTTANEVITADNVIRLFPDVQRELHTTHQANGGHVSASSELAGYDEEQIRLMDEVCIVLDQDDNPIGSASKKTCHLMSNINKGLLHRAFSCFLFEPGTHRLLLQQRASEKITFPDMWTNTCCSHPLGVPGETGADLPSSVMGVKRAAQRKLDQELGIKQAQVPLDKFQFLTRIHYLAPSDGTWGEHEIDYIIFITTHADVEPNLNEVQASRYVTSDELKRMFADPALKFTPWFKLICETMLFEWWDKLRAGGIDKYLDEPGIRRML